jgi:NAD(P)-dependent dehydrogenase (short-subunit alcohol dehydrogenase family)
VTGGNRGIGLEVCRQLAVRGYHVVLTARDLSKAQAAADAIRAEPRTQVTAARLDVADETSIRELAADLNARTLSIDVLVNNAGILLGESTHVLDQPIAEFRATFETNVFGAVVVSQAFVPGMVERGYGRVVNVSSEAGQLASMSTYAPAYSMSKAALNAFTRQLAAATRATGVLVNSACPGWVRTDMGGPAAPRSVEQGADTSCGWPRSIQAVPPADSSAIAVPSTGSANGPLQHRAGAIFQLAQALFEQLPRTLDCPIVGARWHVERLADRQRNGGERFRHLCAVPAVHFPAAVCFDVKRDDRITARLSEPDGARLRDASGAARAVDGDADRLPRCDVAAQLKERLARTARRRAASGRVSETFDDAGDPLAVEVLACDDDDAALAEEVGGGQDASVPKREDRLMSGGGDAIEVLEPFSPPPQRRPECGNRAISRDRDYGRFKSLEG